MFKDLVKNKRHIQQKIETVPITDIEVLTGFSNRKSHLHHSCFNFRR